MKSASVFTALVVIALAAGWTLLPRVAHSHGAVTTTVLFDREIVRILSNRCVSCHMDGGLAFPLSTYEQTWLKGQTIRTAVLRHQMPPWAAVSGYGAFVNDNALTLRETQFLVSWVEGLGPRNGGTVFLNVNDPQAVTRQEVRAVAHVGHWQLGEPDLVRSVDGGRIEARQGDSVKRVVFDLGLTGERRLRAIEYLPGDRRVVRGVSFTLQQTGQWLGSWTPWHGFTKLPSGVASRLPAGSRIVADVDYRGASEAVTDRGSLGLFFGERTDAPTAPDLVLHTSRDSSGSFRATASLMQDTHVWALNPEIDAAVASLEVSARRSDGATDVLLYARDVPPEWPTPYILKQPTLIRRGSQITMVARLKDGASNPRDLRMRIARY
jgi:mono/diheme cytochrome c family protein